ncbi:MAG: JAB domain-containing protein [Bacteroidota bacterium]|nr:JAB domain-containing protein [Bacteroidota bacterium]
MEDIKQVAEITVSYRPAISHKPIIKSSLDSFTELKPFFEESTLYLQEQFVVMYLNRCNRVLGVYKLSQGGISGTVADIRLILGTALKVAATGIILCHSHPSGNLQPSYQDATLTKKIRPASDLMDIKLLDHIIVGNENNYLSMADEGLLYE